jgi:histone acetyltransferase (RNA polymerase elongator complex component)
MNLMKLSKINIKRIQVGLQSVSLEVNKDTKRGFKKEAFEITMQKMKSLDIGLSLDIIL